MTTQVKIEVVQNHMPVAVDVMWPDGTLVKSTTLQAEGDSVEEYVHGGQTLSVRELPAA